MYICATVFVISVCINGAIIIWLNLTAPSENKLFYKLFDTAVKEEIFLTEIEKGFDCISDDDKELENAAAECDNAINRSVISSKYLVALLIAWTAIHSLAIIIFGFANKDFGESKKWEEHYEKELLNFDK